jgi:hypothetical protein
MLEYEILNEQGQVVEHRLVRIDLTPEMITRLLKGPVTVVADPGKNMSIRVLKTPFNLPVIDLPAIPSAIQPAT